MLKNVLARRTSVGEDWFKALVMILKVTRNNRQRLLHAKHQHSLSRLHSRNAREVIHPEKSGSTFRLPTQIAHPLPVVCAERVF